MFSIQGIPTLGSERADVSTADHAFLNDSVVALQNTSSTDGVVVARLAGDSANSIWYIKAGQSIPGFFTKVIKTGTDAALVNAVIGLVNTVGASELVYLVDDLGNFIVNDSGANLIMD